MYTADQLERRNKSGWTTVQGILAPIQFVVFIISVILVYNAWQHNEGYAIANASILLKIALLWAITLTGMLWEKEIFGHYFLAKEFYWEDIGNLVAIVTHNVYFVVRWLGWDDNAIMATMLIAYATYLINCAQFVRRGIMAAQQRRRATQES
ncbi:MAG: 2-vinyl bacteriochlorophyllide hydratase [Chloroflexi bacterium]|nr:2-vinyl bacteriochlorophyllide hydratase [Chloroflexota bacterium]